MSSIDKRIVEMEFQNEGFEKNIKSSENLLKSFDKTLNQTGRTSFSGLNSVIEGVSGKFSALGTIASGALLKIGAEAVSIGTQLAKSLSLDQITAGFGEYELKLKHIIKEYLYTPKNWNYNKSTECFSEEILEILLTKINSLYHYDIV